MRKPATLFRIVSFGVLGVVVLAVFLTGVLHVETWPAQAHRWAIERDATRTHDGALSHGDILETDAADAYQAVRPPTEHGEDSIGFVSMPSFSSWRAISLRLAPGEAQARVEMADIALPTLSEGVVKRPPLKISPVRTSWAPRSSFTAASEQLYALTHGWRGSGGPVCSDGEPVAFEQARGGRVTSGVGNASCDAHYAAVKRIFQPFIGPRDVTR